MAERSNGGALNARSLQTYAETSAKHKEKLTQDIAGTFGKSVARSLGGRTGQKLVRGLLGSLFGKK